MTIDYKVSGEAAGNFKTDCAIVAIFADNKMSSSAASIDKMLGGIISDAIKSGDAQGKLGHCCSLVAESSSSIKRVVIVGCGEKKTFNDDAFQNALQASFSLVQQTASKHVACYLTRESVKGQKPYHLTRRALLIVEYGFYRFDQFKSDPDQITLPKTITFSVTSAQSAQAKKAVKEGKALAQGISLTRDLGNLPANVCTPSYLANEAKKLASAHKSVKTEVLDEAAMKKLKMHSLLSVTNGAKEPAKLIIIKYQGAAASQEPVVLVGKGITFDTGGISLKPPLGMDEMKYDMCGAGSVLGTMTAVAGMKLKKNVIGVVPSCENMPSDRATRPGDIVTSMSGKTIEILNTDAEGRLILCDALTYAKRFKPKALIDIATLTGACVIALGEHFAGLMSNNDKLANALQKAGKDASDPLWRLPLGPGYHAQLKSPFADLANVGGKAAGTITAGCFLQSFVDDDTPWAHVDIAGVAWKSGTNKSGTGRPVAALVEYIMQA